MLNAFTSAHYSDRLTVMAQNHCQIVLSPGADVGQDGGGVRGAEAEAELLLRQVSFHTQSS